MAKKYILVEHISKSYKTDIIKTVAPNEGTQSHIPAAVSNVKMLAHLITIAARIPDATGSELFRYFHLNCFISSWVICKYEIKKTIFPKKEIAEKVSNFFIQILNSSKS